MKELTDSTGFQWDDHNTRKIWEKHHVTPSECEQAFFNLPFIAAEDEKHSQNEKRYFALGQTDTGRRLYMVFTFRKSLIRFISARDMSRKERKVYEQS
ncbi:MAG TPA: BrnT family toxin [Kiritimatiellia bacterium]|nr:BrnT family toxin [Saprospiraceae bacterium]HMP00812.1 BrnT family toxin [Kiritimatiellia bacterium]